MHRYRHVCGIVGQYIGGARGIENDGTYGTILVAKWITADYTTNLIKDCHINNLHLPHCQVRELRV